MIYLAQLLLLNLVFAHIPHAHFILKKVSENAGRSTYKITQEVSFQTSEERLTVLETWYIDDGFQMYLEAKGPQFSYTAKYDLQSKYQVNSNGNLISQRLSRDFFEGLFHFRNERDLARSLAALNLVSQDVLQPQRRFYNLSEVSYSGQPFIKLDRVDRSTAYKMFNANDAKNPSGIWIEQDSFHILKIVSPQSATLKASDYDSFSNGLKLPRLRTIDWGQNQTPVRVLRVEAIRSNDEIKSLLNHRSLVGLSKNEFGNTRLSSAVKAFYERFR